LTRLWAPIGSRPRAPRDSRYEWAYIFGAVCPERAIGVGLVMPYANSEAMNLHLQAIGRAIAPGAHAVLVLDGAGWHTSQTLQPPDNITLLCLPPYSPELNPTENIWEYLRKNKLALRVFDCYDDIVDACCAAWTDLIAIPDRLASITARDWAHVS
jgi:transposase